jgi:hypothetical protein
LIFDRLAKFYFGENKICGYKFRTGHNDESLNTQAPDGHFTHNKTTFHAEQDGGKFFGKTLLGTIYTIECMHIKICITLSISPVR